MLLELNTADKPDQTSRVSVCGGSCEWLVVPVPILSINFDDESLSDFNLLTLSRGVILPAERVGFNNKLDLYLGSFFTRERSLSKYIILFVSVAHPQ